MFNPFHRETNLVQETDAAQRHDEYQMLMSMALDDLLDSEERVRLDHHLIACKPCHRQWEIWQGIDQQFQFAPEALPPVGFVQKFENRLERREANRTLRVGVTLAVLTLALWLVGIAGIGLVLGYLVMNGVGWFAETFEWLAYGWTFAQVIGVSTWRVVVGLIDHPSTAAAVACYVLLSVTILAGWTRFLKRSIQPLDMQSV